MSLAFFSLKNVFYLPIKMSPLTVVKSSSAIFHYSLFKSSKPIFPKICFLQKICFTSSSRCYEVGKKRFSDQVNWEKAVLMLNRFLLHINMHYYIPREHKMHNVHQVYLTPKPFCQGATLLLQIFTTFNTKYFMLHKLNMFKT